MLATIVTAQDMDIVIEAGGYCNWVLALARARYGTSIAIDWTIDQSAQRAQAEIHAGKWVVQCPDCPEKLLYEPGQPFFCPNCLNGNVGNKTRGVNVPYDRAMIERLLIKRPNPLNRNWLADETLMDLKVENIIHGVMI